MAVDLDTTDRRILDILQSGGRLTNQEVAEQCGVSAAACWRRMRALESNGIIRRYTALLDRQSLDLKFCIFVHVSLARHETANVENFVEAIVQRPEVLECYATTGDADFMLKVTQGEPRREFSVPEGIRFEKVNAKTGQIAGLFESNPVTVALRRGQQVVGHDNRGSGGTIVEHDLN